MKQQLVGLRRRLGVGCVLAFAGIVAVACNEALVGAGPPDFLGTVETVTPTPRGADVLLADIDPPPDPGPSPHADAELFFKKIVWIVGKTRIMVREPDGSVRTGGLSDIQIGSRLTVKTDGLERRSLPPQYEAVWVEVAAPAN